MVIFFIISFIQRQPTIYTNLLRAMTYLLLLHFLTPDAAPHARCLSNVVNAEQRYNFFLFIFISLSYNSQFHIESPHLWLRTTLIALLWNIMGSMILSCRPLQTCYKRAVAVLTTSSCTNHVLTRIFSILQVYPRVRVNGFHSFQSICYRHHCGGTLRGCEFYNHTSATIHLFT